MRIWRRSVAAGHVEAQPAEPAPVSSLVWDLGDLYCTARGCTQKTGLACSYIDRRERPCPTAWCPEHRYITHGAVYCPAHGALLDGTAYEFRECVRVDLGNAVPTVLSWIVQEIDAEVSAAMLQLAMEWHQALVLDPVHFALAGVQRIRCWERAWKVCDNLGPTLRVSAVIEEAKPSVVEARVNTRPVLRLEIPWHESHGFGERPATAAESRVALLEFRQRLLSTLIRAIAEWRRDNLGNREVTEAALTGMVWNGSPGSATFGAAPRS